MNTLINETAFVVSKNGKKLLRNNDVSIETTRGDTLLLSVIIDDIEQSVDTAYFTVKEAFNEANPIFQLSIGSGISRDEIEENKYTIRVSPAFASLLDVGSYYYDFQIGVGADIYTLFKGILRVSYDVTGEIVTPILYDVSDATATAADVAYGTTAYIAGGKVSGTYSKLGAVIGRTITELTENDFYGATTIGDSAFKGCESLENVTIPNGVRIIGNSAFKGCESIESVTIPGTTTGGVTSIGNEAFYGCSGLTKIIYASTKAKWRAISKGTDWDYNTGNYTIYCTDGNIPKQ